VYQIQGADDHACILPGQLVMEIRATTVQVELAFGFPPPDVGAAGFKFGFGGLINLGLLPDDVLDEQPIVDIVANRKAKSNKYRIARLPQSQTVVWATSWWPRRIQESSCPTSSS